MKTLNDTVDLLTLVIAKIQNIIEFDYLYFDVDEHSPKSNELKEEAQPERPWLQPPKFE